MKNFFTKCEKLELLDDKSMDKLVEALANDESPFEMLDLICEDKTKIKETIQSRLEQRINLNMINLLETLNKDDSQQYLSYIENNPSGLNSFNNSSQLQQQGQNINFSDSERVE